MLDKDAGLLIEDTAEPDGLPVSQSLLRSAARSILAAPLATPGKKLGVVYLDATGAKAPFDEVHLQLLTAIATSASAAIGNARQMEWLEQELRRAGSVAFDMIGESDGIERVRNLIRKVAPTESTVLVTGETGTGKELVARAIHVGSPRSSRKFVAVNCATLTDSLLESDLFGHEKGAFTGAVSTKKGKLEIADGGTIFLDEVGELAANLQAKLLRVLQNHEFERVGGTTTLKVSIRVVAATNRDLQQAIQDGSFRQDLFFRLNVFSISVPPLRERPEDISLLASHFVAKHTKRMNRRILGASAATHELLRQYDWPGNIRELENAIERGVVMCSGDAILPEDLPENLLECSPPDSVSLAEFHEAVTQFKKDFVTRAVREADGNYTKAAKRLGLHPNNLHRLIRNLNLKEALKAAGR